MGLSVGDFIKIGNDIAKVNGVTFQVASSKTSTKALASAQLDLPASGYTAHSTAAGKAFGWIYRISVQKEIREALKAIPNQRIEGVAVQYMNHYRNAFATTAAVTTSLVDTAANDEGFVTFGGGEQIRFAIRGSTSAVVLQTSTNGAASGALWGHYDTQKYRIRFSTGCSDDSHCNNNGKNTLMSDTSAKCNHGGYCVCNPGHTVADAYFGHGCTSDGKGDHSAPYVRSNGGDLPLLRCDKSQLTSSRHVGDIAGGTAADTSAGAAIVGHVTMADNTKIVTTDISGATADATNLFVELLLASKFAWVIRSALSLQLMLRGSVWTAHLPRTASRISLSWAMSATSSFSQKQLWSITSELLEAHRFSAPSPISLS